MPSEIISVWPCDDDDDEARLPTLMLVLELKDDDEGLAAACRLGSNDANDMKTKLKQVRGSTRLAETN